MGWPTNLAQLYPPVVERMLPVWSRGSAMEAYGGQEIIGFVFTMSSFQSYLLTEDGKPYILDSNERKRFLSLQISIVDGDTNRSILDPNLWPLGIRYLPIQKLGSTGFYDDNCFIAYYNNQNALGDSFVANKTYKIQARLMVDPFYIFSGCSIENDGTGNWRISQEYFAPTEENQSPPPVYRISGDAGNNGKSDYSASNQHYSYPSEEGNDYVEIRKKINLDIKTGKDDAFTVTLNNTIIAREELWDYPQQGSNSYGNANIHLKYSPVNKERMLLSMSEAANNFLNAGGYLSEWSSICLLQKVPTPVVRVNNVVLKSGESESSQDKNPTIEYDTQLLMINGSINFSSTENGNTGNIQLENVTKVVLTLSDSSNNAIIEKTEITDITTLMGISTFQYKCTQLLDEGTYILKVEYWTRNSYEQNHFPIDKKKGSVASTTAKIKITFDKDIPEGINLFYTPDDIKGYIDLNLITTNKFSNKDVEGKERNYVVVRSDGTTNFGTWEELCVIKSLSNGSQKIHFVDATAESGIQYKYALQRWVNENSRGVVINPQQQEVVIPFYEDFYFTNGYGHYCLSYNRVVSNYRHNILETRTDTIGSRYPFIYRNAHVDYRTFQISGTISYSDNNYFYLRSLKIGDTPYYEENNLIREDISKGFKTYEDLYPYEGVRNTQKEYNFNHNIDTLYDITLEREFRKKAIEFLQNGEPILFKSAAEGNVLIRLMDFSFSPKNELSNLVYDFSCTAVEIDECSIENYDKYNIQWFDQEVVETEYTNSAIVERLGQI